MADSVEQRARDMLERMEIEGARTFTDKDVGELADLFSDRDQLLELLRKLRREIHDMIGESL